MIRNDTPWIALIGSFALGRNPVHGARAPLARIVSQVRADISRHFAESSRTKVHYMSLYLERCLLEEFDGEYGLVCFLRYDCAPMPLYVNGVLDSREEICVGDASAFGTGGGILELSPTTRNPRNSTSLGISGIYWEIRYVCANYAVLEPYGRCCSR